ncbi:MAG: O-antigen ligase family protein [Candidatus Latescibacterota bacterium]|nr:MAG: O-antigen ligase family protein [Candidatus Latescibacterota bacterium]
MHPHAGAVLTRKQATFFFLFAALLAFAVLTYKYVLPMYMVKLAAFGVVASVMGLLIFSYPKQALYVAVFYIYAGLRYYTPSFPLAHPIVVLIAAATLYRHFRGEEVRLKDSLYLWSSALFTLLAIQSMFVSYDHMGSLRVFSVVLKVLVMVYLVNQLLNTPKEYERLAMVILAGVIATVILGLVNIRMGWVRDETLITGLLSQGRFAGAHVNPNMGALYILAGLPLAVYAIRRAGRMATRIALVLIAVGLVVAVIMTFSRQALFPLLVVLIAVLVREGRSKWVFLVVLAAVLIGILLTPSYYWHRLRTITHMIQGVSEDWSFFLRLQAHITAWNLFVENPLTGVGLSNFPVRSASEVIARIPTHDAYLDVLVEVGILGFAAYMAVLFSGIRGFITAMRTRWDSEHRWMRDLSFYFLISFLSSLFGAFFQSAAYYYLLWIPVAGGVLARRLALEAGQNTKISET